MNQHSFFLKPSVYPLVSSDDTLVIVHRNQVAPNAVLYICAHEESTVELRSALDRAAVETAAAWSTQILQAGAKIKIDLPGTGNALHVVTTVIPTRGRVYVAVVSIGEFDTYFKQVNVSGS